MSFRMCFSLAVSWEGDKGQKPTSDLLFFPKGGYSGTNKLVVLKRLRVPENIIGMFLLMWFLIRSDKSTHHLRTSSSWLESYRPEAKQTYGNVPNCPGEEHPHIRPLKLSANCHEDLGCDAVAFFTVEQTVIRDSFRPLPCNSLSISSSPQADPIGSLRVSWTGTSILHYCHVHQIPK